jgi:hypothetical protein
LHGKPVFHAYGKGNRNPTVGGIVYGHYMLTHNINPHRRPNCPTYFQVYNSAHNKAFENGEPKLEPTRDLPKPVELTKEELEDLKTRNPIMPGEPARNMKRHVKQLDLMKEVCFASKHSTPAPSEFVTEDGNTSRRSSRRKSVEQSDRKSVGQTSHKQKNVRGQSARPRKTVKASAAPVQVNQQQQEAQAQIQAFAKGSNLKASRGKQPDMMKTMASTGNFNFSGSKNQEPERTLSPIPAPQDADQEEIAIHQSEGSEADEQDENYNEENPSFVQESFDQSRSQAEVNPTVFPVGFPF